MVEGGWRWMWLIVGGCEFLSHCLVSSRCFSLKCLIFVERLSQLVCCLIFSQQRLRFWWIQQPQLLSDEWASKRFQADRWEWKRREYPYQLFKTWVEIWAMFSLFRILASGNVSLISASDWCCHCCIAVPLFACGECLSAHHLRAFVSALWFIVVPLLACGWSSCWFDSCVGSQGGNLFFICLDDF